MSDDRKKEVKVPNLLTPEQGRVLETEQTEAQEPAVPVQAVEEMDQEIAPSETPSNVIALPKREVVQAAPRPERDPVTKAIDGILEANLGKFVDDMSKADQERFIAEGERLTTELVALVQQKHPNFSHALDQITKWLHMLPMLSKEFLRQEAKRKCDQVEMYVQRESERGQLAA